MKKIGRNDPCPCGSGQKYKRCCLLKQAERRNFRSKVMLALLGVFLAVGGTFLVKGFIDADPDAVQAGRVWSPEHGHWHYTGPATRPAPVTSLAPPPGPAPAGKVWSPEHGHWHTVRPAEGSRTDTNPLAPPGPAPAGKVWSPEHGHWDTVR